MSKTLLVTGGSGFIGSNFVRYYLNRYPDDRIINLDKLTYAGNPANLSDFDDDDRYRFVHGDICDVELVESLVADCDGVFNFAAESHVDRSILGGAEFVQTDVYGTYVLLEAARKHEVERFHQISTDEVYGSLTEGAWDEGFPMEPRNPYSASKASAEMLVRAYHITHGLQTVVTRASNNIGPYQYPEKRVPLYITNAIDDQPLPVYGNGLQIRDHLFVDDHCSAIDLVFHEGVAGEAYNVGGENEANGVEVARAILDQLGKPESLLQFVEDRAGHDQRYALNSGKVRQLGWQPAVDTEESMRRTIQWYVDNESWWRDIKASDDYLAYYKRQYGERLK
ncbi:MAG: dTDP-glucose 4,6-dehydratase [Gemmatimonadetes bacterium]|nr:dTDP-glucose 4,6-dehydratase [Gemmatimonadota bacterium]MBT4611863.1 dTDP-glucose 4,6-dehydratase [Gemmatimonadota bacterium]MBT5056613.1 dTDP-glucose 4,6-dehydratase [Gemmatimonadota bacterium]MBT5145205.1 dTDP-glucose 4,6-dehydratase [Gemmatimonadota bacterium]MBT5586980.1 dTDP-glucose 4,6-dehydratase [Gemmatimonadota bacterium]